MSDTATSQPLTRLTQADYADERSAMRDPADPVEIARAVFSQDGDIPSVPGLSVMFVSFGQLVDHDLSLTPDESGEIVFVDGLAGPFQRSLFDPETGESAPREQVNIITPELDASHVYGSDAEREAALREGVGGRLALSEDPTSAFGLMPFTEEGGPTMAGDDTPDAPLFLAGDVRANENAGLTLMHIVFVREHNHWADTLAAEHPDWTDQQIFEAARSIVEAELQKIIYQDWLPHLIGAAVSRDWSHDPEVDGQVSTEFSTAAFRFGHTSVSSEIARLSEDGATAPEGDLTVDGVFFTVEPFTEHGVDSLVRGQAGGLAQEIDAKVVDDLNFFLELANGLTGFSLPALNILRGRDHGIGSYIDVRAAVLGDIDPEALDPNDFSVITDDAAVQAELASVYATVFDVDLWVGGLAETDAAGSELGATFTAIIADQFSRTRAADETFAELSDLFSQEEADALRLEIAQTSLSDILLRTTGVDHLQDDVFQAAGRMMGDADDDWLVGAMNDDLIMGMDGDDALFGRDSDDSLYGGDGDDALMGGRGADMLLGEAGDDALFGGHGRDFLAGGVGEDTLKGAGAGDRLDGNQGDDVLEGQQGGDLLQGQRGDDVLEGGNGDDVLRGNVGDDVLRGESGDDRLSGGDGADRLNGGRGDDLLIGGRGADQFVFFGDVGEDVIFDFAAGEDLIDLRAFDLDAANATALLKSALTEVAGGTRLDLSKLGGEGGVLIEGATSLTTADFLL